MDFKENAKIISAESKDWKMGDSSGVSHKVRMLIGTEIFETKTSEEIVKTASNYLGQDVEVRIRISSPREKLKIELLAIL